MKEDKGAINMPAKVHLLLGFFFCLSFHKGRGQLCNKTLCAGHPDYQFNLGLPKENVFYQTRFLPVSSVMWALDR